MKTRLLTASLLAAGLMTSVAATAADTYSLGVSATVLGRCIFTQTAGATLAFGSIDPSSTSNATGSATLTYKCTKGQAPTFAAGLGTNTDGTNNRLATGSPATDHMIYTLALVSGGSGTGFGAAENKSLTVNALWAIISASSNSGARMRRSGETSRSV